MKKYIALFILTFMICNLLVGCVTPPETPDNQGAEGNGESAGNNQVGGGDNTENGDNTQVGGGDNTENGGNTQVGGGENTENGDNNQGGGGDNTESGGNTQVGGGDNTENGDNTQVGGGDNTESGDNTQVGGGDNTENGGNTQVGGGDNTENGGTEPDHNPLPDVGSEVGKLFRSITLERLGGGTVSPDDYRGKIVVVNIWATWCPPCLAELPDFNRVASDYADDVVIIAAHDYSGRENAPAYVQNNFPDSKIIFAYDSYYGDAFFAAGGTRYVPMTAVLDQRGVIVYSDSGAMSYQQLSAIIESLLNK